MEQRRNGSSEYDRKRAHARAQTKKKKEKKGRKKKKIARHVRKHGSPGTSALFAGDSLRVCTRARNRRT